MSNRRMHVTVGSIAGAGFAGYRAREQKPLALALEAFGGYHGGRHGARLHDLLEPATTPLHRNVCHGIGFNTAAFAFGKKMLDSAQADLRARARELVDHANDPETGFIETALCLVGAGLAHIGVGYLNGAAAGAGSHLLLDAGTAQGLPLLCRGF